MYSPEFFVDSIFNLNFDYLKSKGYKYILIDVDNTILPYGAKKINNKVKSWIKKGEKKGFLFYIISNANKKRVKIVSDFINIPYIYRANKPSIKGIKKILKEFKGNKKEFLLIGDQFCTDIIAAKRAKIHSVLVEPLTKKDFFITKIYRLIEWFFKKKFKKENICDEK